MHYSKPYGSVILRSLRGLMLWPNPMKLLFIPYARSLLNPRTTSTERRGTQSISYLVKGWSWFSKNTIYMYMAIIVYITWIHVYLFRSLSFLFFKKYIDIWEWDYSSRIMDDINKFMRTKCGFATLHDVVAKTKEDRMESFFLSEVLIKILSNWPMIFMSWR